MTNSEETRILVVDDYPGLAQLIQRSLGLQGFEVKGALDGMAALGLIREWNPHLVILDLMLPGMGGLEILRSLREFSPVPVIILTARSEQEFILQGLGAGADDYLTKPFHLNELLMRVKAVLRRTGRREIKQARELIKVGGLDFDFANYRIGSEGNFKKLTPIEYRLLYYLLLNEGRVVPYGELLAEVWGWGYSEDENNLRVYIKRLRNLIEPEPREPRHIITVRGIGYMFLNEKDNQAANGTEG